MAVLIVDPLEVVEIEQNVAERCPSTQKAGVGAAQFVEHADAVESLGEGVVPSLVVEPGLQGALLAHVA